MAYPLKTQLMFWSVAILFFFGVLWLFNDILTPFVLGMVIAYLLNPLVKMFSTQGIKRTTSSALIIIIFFLIATMIIALVVPIIAKESALLIEKMPGYLDYLFNLAQPHAAWLQKNFGDSYIADAQTFLKSNITKILSFSGGVAGGLAAGGQAVAGALTTLLLTPLVAFFMMKEWPAITRWVEDLIPRDNEKVIKGLLGQINRKLSGFIRGQLTVAFFLGTIYAISLTIAGLNYGFLIGVTAGILSIIPMVGSTLGLLVSIAVAWFQVGEWQYVAIIAAIFIVGQIVEGNFLTPKLVGDSVGLHPLWVMFALLAGGSLFGILGMLIAVPVAAVVGVLMSFAILQYKKSPFYKKATPEPTPPKKQETKP